MISQVDKFREGPLAETEIQVPPSGSQEDRVLSRLNQNFRMSKAQQILRLLKDQDNLNQRFRDCALLDDEGDEARAAPGRRHEEGDPDNWSLEEEQHSDDDDDGGSDTSGHEAERRAARRVALRRHRNSIDPGRCKTSMGFHNRAEVTDIPYDTDSDNVAGVDSACSTPRGGVVASGALSARQTAAHPNRYGAANVARGGVGSGVGSNSSNANSRLRVYQLKIGENSPHDRDLDVPEECLVQSARSSRPKTSLTSMGSPSRNRYYRQQPHPESHYKSSMQQSHVQHSAGYHHFSRQQHGQQHGQVAENTRQAIISRLDPNHPMAVRPFCGSQEDVRRSGAGQQPSSSSQPSTPRSGGVPALHHTEVTLFDMAPSLSKDNNNAATPTTPRRGGLGSGTGLQGHGVARTPSFSDNHHHHHHHHQRVTPTNRALLSVSSSSLQLGGLSPRGRTPGEDPSTPRRLTRSTRVKKKVGEMPRVVVPTSVHPAMTVMKLPPLDSSGGKSGSGRDLVCVGKD